MIDFTDLPTEFILSSIAASKGFVTLAFAPSVLQNGFSANFFTYVSLDIYDDQKTFLEESVKNMRLIIQLI